MNESKGAALKLRLRGKSYGEIQKLLGTPKSTLSGWFSRLVLRKDIIEKIERRGRKKSIAVIIKRNKNQTHLAIQRSASFRKEASKEVGTLSKRDVFLLGVALYWAEGYKRPKIVRGREVTHHPISLTNSDPYLVKIFLKFLREYCEVPQERIKASLRIFKHQNEEELKNFWHKETTIPLKNFGKTYCGIRKSSMGKRPFNRLPYGVIQIIVANTNLFHKIMGYIEGLKKLE